MKQTGLCCLPGSPRRRDVSPKNENEYATSRKRLQKAGSIMEMDDGLGSDPQGGAAQKSIDDSDAEMGGINSPVHAASVALLDGGAPAGHSGGREDEPASTTEVQQPPSTSGPQPEPAARPPLSHSAPAQRKRLSLDIVSPSVVSSAVPTPSQLGQGGGLFSREIISSGEHEHDILLFPNQLPGGGSTGGPSSMPPHHHLQIHPPLSGDTYNGPSTTQSKLSSLSASLSCSDASVLQYAYDFYVFDFDNLISSAMLGQRQRPDPHTEFFRDREIQGHLFSSVVQPVVVEQQAEQSQVPQHHQPAANTASESPPPPEHARPQVLFTRDIEEVTAREFGGQERVLLLQELFTRLLDRRKPFWILSRGREARIKVALRNVGLLRFFENAGSGFFEGVGSGGGSSDGAANAGAAVKGVSTLHKVDFDMNSQVVEEDDAFFRSGTSNVEMDVVVTAQTTQTTAATSDENNTNGAFGSSSFSMGRFPSSRSAPLAVRTEDLDVFAGPGSPCAHGPEGKARDGEPEPLQFYTPVAGGSSCSSSAHQHSSKAHLLQLGGATAIANHDVSSSSPASSTPFLTPLNTSFEIRQYDHKSRILASDTLHRPKGAFKSEQILNLLASVGAGDAVAPERILFLDDNMGNLELARDNMTVYQPRAGMHGTGLNLLEIRHLIQALADSP
mmetsp:Transcript_27918/g.70592  ORF Transcript_27918/g.70592 Transcript_27918/m.70592 type:complete len:673 (+) Transcript_27918:2520-4538(+)|eukprot:CAMPEP_0178992816 /NCGR_PEP_ID=MMETSP0795-20121207/6333_1 /TAXON_ID=88552 /ORGANISM="Amoebophrya sp., Strain Ameob2" /LENGTH=672 /DNA_ID=CAMNT_0020684757 /DNA_START=527 /DNA_END=2545 /DNA_ORIENTATION=-